VTALVVALTVVVGLLTLLVVGLLHSHAEILRRLHDLGAGIGPDDADGPVGVSGPRTLRRDEFNVFPEVPSPNEREGFTATRDLAGVGLGDDAVTVRVAGTNHRTLVAFLSSGCLTCQRFWDAFAKPGTLGLPDDVRLVIATKDLAEESPSKLANLAPKDVPTVASSRAWVDYDVPGSPYFVLVDGPSGQVRGEGTGLDWDQVRNLLTQATDDAGFDRRAESAYRQGLERSRVAKPDADTARESRIDEELLAAGVRPGDPSLYQGPQPPPDPGDAVASGDG